MHSRSLRLVTAVAGSFLCAATAFAQGSPSATSRPTIGVSAGLALPTGDFGDGFNSGYNVSAHVAFKPAVSPVGIRVEGMYNRFGLDGGGTIDGNANILGLTGNAIVGPAVKPGSMINPYLIGGLGFYSSKFDSNVGASDRQTDLGANVGGGLNILLSGLDVFIEARYHTVFTDGSNTGFIPLVVGIRF